MPDTLRVFVALEIPKGIRTALVAVQSELRQQGVRARWVQPGGIHLTLKFLGNIPARQVPDVADAMRVAAGRCAPMCLCAGGIGVFPSFRRPRVIWIGLSGQAGCLLELQRGLEDGLSALGFPKDARAFRGHVTIGRFAGTSDFSRMPEVVTSYAERAFGSFEVREVVLYRSDLQPQGPVYTALAKATLNES